MAEASSSNTARAVRGIEAAAFVLANAVEGFAVAGGEGAERLAAAMPASGVQRLEGRGLEAARAAVGHAAAGKRTALIASGEAIGLCLPALREMSRLGLPVLIVAPSHGPEVGTALPAPGYDDVAQLATMPLGLLIASNAEQVADFALAGLRAAHDRAAPWVLSFDLAGVGLVLSNARLPEADLVRRWAAGCLRAAGNDAPPLSPPERDLEGYRRDLERYSFALGAAMRELERALRRPIAPVLAEGAREPDVTVICAGASARGARQAVGAAVAAGLRPVAALQVASMRPFPAAEVVRVSWRARAVIVHECFPEPLGTGGALSDAVRASFADALTWHPAFAGIGRIPPVVTVLGPDVSAEQWLGLIRTAGDAADPPRLLVPDAGLGGGAAETRVEIAMDEAGREAALRLVVDWLARTGGTVAAHAHEPLRAGITVARGEGSRAPATVLLALPGGAYDTARIGSLPAGSAVVLAGDFPDRVLAETMRAAASRGVRVATLGGHGVAVRGDVATAAVVRALSPNESALDAALEGVLAESGLPEAGTTATHVRSLAEALRAQFG